MASAVEGLLGILVLVLFSADSDSNFVGNVSDTVGPQVSVELSVDSHVLRKHNNDNATKHLPECASFSERIS